MMPKVGSLWFWRGNYYDVVAVRENQIMLRECGTQPLLIQTYVNGEWDTPLTTRQYALATIARRCGSLVALSVAERQELPPGTHFCHTHGKDLVFGGTSCVC